MGPLTAIHALKCAVVIVGMAVYTLDTHMRHATGLARQLEVQWYVLVWQDLSAGRQIDTLDIHSASDTGDSYSCAEMCGGAAIAVMRLEH